MSMTAGYFPGPAPGRYTSPTRFTPSLAGIITSDIFVMSAACAGPAASAMHAKTKAQPSSASARPGMNHVIERNPLSPRVTPQHDTDAGAAVTQWLAHFTRIG